MHLVNPPKFYNITIVSKFLLGIKVVPREIEENGYAILLLFLFLFLGEERGCIMVSVKIVNFL